MKQKTTPTLIEKIYEKDSEKYLKITNASLNKKRYIKDIFGLHISILKDKPIIQIIENNKTTCIFEDELTKFKNAFNKDFIEP
jgi:hypothetical protein